MSFWANVFLQMSFWANVFWANVLLGKCPSEQTSFWANVFWANVFLGKCLSGQMSFWANVFLGKCLSGQTPSGQTSYGQMSIWANVLWANVHLCKCLLSKCRSGQMSLGKCLWANVGSPSDHNICYHNWLPNFFLKSQKNCQKVVKKLSKKLSKSCQKVKIKLWINGQQSKDKYLQPTAHGTKIVHLFDSCKLSDQIVQTAENGL
jgi:hypothetical protein